MSDSSDGWFTPRESLYELVRRRGDSMTVKRMDNVGIVVEDLDTAIEFFNLNDRLYDCNWFEVQESSVQSCSSPQQRLC
jgi:hypothetical protein